MTALSLADDETPIKVLPATKDWCENYAWGGFDPKSGIGHFFSLGRWLGDIQMWRSITHIALRDGRVLTSKCFGYSNERGPGSSELSLNIIEPKKRLQLVFDGVVGAYGATDLYTNGFHEAKPKRLKFTFDFVSDEPLWDIGGHADESAVIVGSGHIEQQGVVTGLLSYGDDVFVIHPSLATRDHSRGVRDMSAYKRHCWHNGVFPSGLRFYSYYFEVKGMPEGSAMTLAAVSKGGKLYPAKITPGWGKDRPTSEEAQQPFNIAIESELGLMELVGLPQNTMAHSTSHTPYDCHLGWSAAYPFDATLFFEQSTIWKWKGHEDGYGHTERGIKT